MSAHARKDARRKPRDKGFVLVCVLWVLAILTVVTVGFGRRAMLENRAAAFSLDHVQAMFMARGAVERGIAEIRNKAKIDYLFQQANRTSYAQQWAKPVDMLKEGGYFSSMGGDEFADDVCEYTIRDECSLISINAAKEDLIKEIEGISFSARRSILRRRAGVPRANVPKQPFQAIEELLYTQGIGDDDWFGTDRQIGLRDLLTCWGDGRINVNTASAEVLSCIPKLGETAIEAIVDYRAGGDGDLRTSDDKDFRSIDDVGAQTGISGDDIQALKMYCKVDSGFFTITGVATRRQGKVRATCRATVRVQGPNAWVIKWREEFIDA